MNLQTELRRQREARGWSREEVAHRAGYCTDTIRNAEGPGTPTLPTLQAIAGVYNLEIGLRPKGG